jgi:hypothetical protein
MRATQNLEPDEAAFVEVLARFLSAEDLMVLKAVTFGQVTAFHAIQNRERAGRMAYIGSLIRLARHVQFEMEEKNG